LDTIRTFIALPLTSEVHQALRDIQNELRETVGKARWTRPEGIHITLKFLGDTGKDLVGAIGEALDGIARRHQSFELTLNGTGAFPSLSNPRVLWVGIGNSESLLMLQKEVEEAIEPFGYSSEKRQFKAHLTLARLKGDRWPETDRTRLIEASEFTDGLKIPVRELILFQSELKPAGAVYTALHRSKLQS